MKVNGCAYLPSCLPNTFNLLSLCSHSVCFILNCVHQKTKFRVLISILIKVQICRLLEMIRSVFSHIVRRDTSNLPKPSLTLRAANDKNDNGARSTPSSKIMPKHDEASGGIGKNISVDSWGQCALIRRNGRIKSTGIH